MSTKSGGAGVRALVRTSTRSRGFGRDRPRSAARCTGGGECGRAANARPRSAERRTRRNVPESSSREGRRREPDGLRPTRYKNYDTARDDDSAEVAGTRFARTGSTRSSSVFPLELREGGGDSTRGVRVFVSRQCSIRKWTLPGLNFYQARGLPDGLLSRFVRTRPVPRMDSRPVTRLTTLRYFYKAGAFASKHHPRMAREMPWGWLRLASGEEEKSDGKRTVCRRAREGAVAFQVLHRGYCGGVLSKRGCWMRKNCGGVDTIAWPGEGLGSHHFFFFFVFFFVPNPGKGKREQ